MCTATGSTHVNMLMRSITDTDSCGLLKVIH